MGESKVCFLAVCRPAGPAAARPRLRRQWNDIPYNMQAYVHSRQVFHAAVCRQVGWHRVAPPVFLQSSQNFEFFYPDRPGNGERIELTHGFPAAVGHTCVDPVHGDTSQRIGRKNIPYLPLAGDEHILRSRLLDRVDHSMHPWQIRNTGQPVGQNGKCCIARNQVRGNRYHVPDAENRNDNDGQCLADFFHTGILRGISIKRWRLRL